MTDMTTRSFAAAPTKAVLIMEAADGTAVVSTIYDPRFEQEYHEQYSDVAVLSRPGEHALRFSTGVMIQTGKTEDGWSHAQKLYDDASDEYPESFPLAGRADAEQIKAWSEARHQASVHAVYLAGVAVGAKQVQFHDAHFEKLLAEAPLRGIEAVQRELRMLTATKSGKPVQKGLRRALKLAEKVRQTFVQGLSK